MKKIILFIFLMGCLSAPALAAPIHAPVGSAAPVSPADFDQELMRLLLDGVLNNLCITLRDFSCTLSAEVSYNGMAVKMSITAKTCEEAGAGLAQAVKAFYREVAKT